MDTHTGAIWLPAGKGKGLEWEKKEELQKKQ